MMHNDDRFLATAKLLVFLISLSSPPLPPPIRVYNFNRAIFAARVAFRLRAFHPTRAESNDEHPTMKVPKQQRS